MPTKKKNSLVANINRRKKAGVSRPKKKSTVSPEAYERMEKGWPPGKKKSGAAKKKKAKAKATTPLKDPAGGLTAAGRAAFQERDGSHLKPGVTGAADTPEKMRRKGSFLTRMFTHPRGPMVDAKGEPTRLALSAHAWGEAVPKTVAAAHQLAAKGRRLLERYGKEAS